MSRSVYVIEKEYNTISIRKPSIETFGENLTVITDEVFGNRGVSKQFKKILGDLIDRGYSYDKIVSEIESDNVPMSLSTKIYLKSVLND